MNTVAPRVPTKQIKDFSTLHGSNVSRISLSTKFVTAANTTADLWMVWVYITSLLRTSLPLLNPTELRHCCITYIVLLPDIKFRLVVIAAVALV
jgi:hypothetical protein